jgi:hypothetical protein
MDTENLKPKQGADLAADLLKEDSHVEVESESVAVSSEEDRLTAGVCTIKLQTGRLSEAQRRKLTN